MEESAMEFPARRRHRDRPLYVAEEVGIQTTLGVVGASSSTTTSVVTSITSDLIQRTSTPTSSQNNGSSAPNDDDERTPPAAASNVGIKIGAGVAIPLGVILLCTIIYLCIRKRRRRVRSHQESVQPAEDTLNAPWVLQIEPQMLESREPQRPYSKPELSAEAREQVAELPAR
ncbi:MAG: hypothetical protein Q9186_007304 [Xanthomendoza sp. 1 TL-2023]